PPDVALEEILNDTFDKKDSKLSRDIIVRDIILTAGGKALLEKTSLSLVYGRRYGLVGYNGCGKTNLMNALYERKNEFSVVPKYMDTLLVEQEVSASSDTCLQSVMASDTTRLKLLAEEERLTSLPTLTA
ncbi:MAG: ATP-binding cassette domain-containing protein, partial [Proteobacteria bacterium]|nr:ATP-binding cassette domain-containing protein [Pseudomonadota bacterium]